VGLIRNNSGMVEPNSFSNANAEQESDDYNCHSSSCESSVQRWSRIILH